MLKNKSLWYGLVICTPFVLGGCVSRDMSDLETKVQSLLSRPAQKPIDPLPEIKLPESYVYQAADNNAPDPFRSFLDAEAARATEMATKPRDAKTEELMKEIAGRNPEPLEGYDLDALRMVGTLEDADDLRGLVLDKSGQVHTVKIGNYLGRNHGKILSIDEEKIEVREIISTKDGSNGLEERPATLALTEPQ